MRKLLCLMLAVIMLASVAVVAVNAEEPSGFATVTLVNVKGDSVTQTYAVGETFTAYTYLNTSAIAEGRIGSLDGLQTYTQAILEVAETYNKVEEEYDFGLLEDLDTIFPVLGDSNTVANAGVAGRIYYNASKPGYTNAYKFDSDDCALIVIRYTVIAPGEATIENSMLTLAVSDKDLTRIIDKGNIVKQDFESPIALSVPAAPAGFTVSGTITSYATTNTASPDVTVALTGTDNNFTTSVTGTTDYSIENVPAGTYKLTVSKDNHVTRDYEVVVSADTEKNVQICPLGDVSQDGKITSRDSSQAFQYSLGKGKLSEYAVKCGDTVKNDGKIASADASRIYQHSLGNAQLWKK